MPIRAWRCVFSNLIFFSKQFSLLLSTILLWLPHHRHHHHRNRNRNRNDTLISLTLQGDGGAQGVGGDAGKEEGILATPAAQPSARKGGGGGDVLVQQVAHLPGRRRHGRLPEEWRIGREGKGPTAIGVAGAEDCR